MMSIRAKLAIGILAGLSGPAAADVAGSEDHPDIGRYQGSEILHYKVEDYGSTVFATGPVRAESDIESTTLTVEGGITRIVYQVPKGVSALEVFRNFEARVADSNYEIAFSGGPAERLKSDGVGYLAPAATNLSDMGRALNRRIELVQDK